MPTTPPIQAAAREEFDQRIVAIRPKLHRYSARMSGSVVDAEDIVQDALAKAYYLLPTTDVENLEGWLFRIVHNKTIDHLRAAKNSPIDYVDEIPSQSALPAPFELEEMTTLALSIYLQLSPMQRSCVILKDVIGYSLAEISEILDVSVGAIKSALHRGRENLRELVKSSESDAPPVLDDKDVRLLSLYVERFNARDFDAIRAMLADDVRLDLVERLKSQSAEKVGRYFDNYSKATGLWLDVGFVEDKPAILVSESSNPDEYIYFILIQWDQGKIVSIRDFRYARLVMLDAEIVCAS